MESKPIRDGFLVRLLVVTLFKFLQCGLICKHLRRSGPVIFLSSKYCLKSTPFTTRAEAETMHFVAQYTTIPVPRVYCAFEQRGRGYIVMENIPGEMLRENWVRRSQESKDRILSSLRLMIEQLRALSPPSGVGVANASGGPIYDQRLPNDSPFYGPFSSIHEFHLALCEGLWERADRPETLYPGMDKLLAFYQQPWPTPIFTHGDLSSFNILASGDQVVGIIDWETAGWMPPYWEYTSAYNANPQNEFWQKEVDHFLTPLPEALEMETIRRQYYGDY